MSKNFSFCRYIVVEKKKEEKIRGEEEEEEEEEAVLFLNAYAIRHLHVFK
jgi:hypothetical protein